MIFTSPLRFTPEQQIARGHGLTQEFGTPVGGDSSITTLASTTNPPPQLRGLIEPTVNPDCDNSYLLAAGFNRAPVRNTGEQGYVRWQLDYPEAVGRVYRVFISPITGSSEIGVWVDTEGRATVNATPGSLTRLSPEDIEQQFPFLFGDRPYRMRNTGSLTAARLTQIWNTSLPVDNAYILSLGQPSSTRAGILQRTSTELHNYTFSGDTLRLQRKRNLANSFSNLSDGSPPSPYLTQPTDLIDILFDHPAGIAVVRNTNSVSGQWGWVFDYTAVERHITWGGLPCGDRFSTFDVSGLGEGYGGITIQGAEQLSENPNRRIVDSHQALSNNGMELRAVIPCDHPPTRVRLTGPHDLQTILDYYNITKVVGVLVPSPVAKTKYGRKKKVIRNITGRVHVANQSANPVFQCTLNLKGYGTQREVEDIASLDDLDNFQVWPCGLDRGFVDIQHATEWRKAPFTRSCAVTRFDGFSGYEGFDVGPMAAKIVFEETSNT